MGVPPPGISNHPSVQNPETPASYYVLAAFQRCLETLPGYLVFLLRHPLCAEILPVEIPVEKVAVKFEHPQLRQVVNSDPDLGRPG